MIGRLRIIRALAALVIGAAGGTVLSTGAAFAAACPVGTGVTVVVNSSVSCDANGGSPASSNFAGAGQSLKYASRQPGFVCRVNGAPANDPCVNASPANAYWGLFWSDGKSGTWNYSSLGVGSLKVPKGGWVAFKFQSSNSRTNPGVRPYTAPPAPKPKPKPSVKATTAAPPKATATAKATAKAKADEKAKAKASASPSAKAGASATGRAPSASPSASASASAQAAAREESLRRTSQETDSSSSTLWVGVLLALALLGGMGFAVWQRRARRS